MDCRVGESMETLPSPDSTSDTWNFECHICFESAQDPIVTLCGHLYCWPCLYQWLRFHSHSHECPVCKAIVYDEKVVPIYGRGKPICDPRSKLPAGVSIPYRSIPQRPRTAPLVDFSYVHSSERDPMSFMPMTIARIGHTTLSTIFGALPGIFNSIQMQGFHDATLYGSTFGAPNLFSSSFHGGYYRSEILGRKPFAWKIALAILSFLVLMCVILA